MDYYEIGVNIAYFDGNCIMNPIRAILGHYGSSSGHHGLGLGGKGTLRTETYIENN